MAITRERFEQGMTAEEYKAQMTRNRERLEDNEQDLSIPTDDVQFFAQLPHPLNVIVLTEDWCEPAVVNVPVLTQLARESGKLNLRFFLRDQNPDLMSQYLKDGLHPSIPTFVFFNQQFNELGRWMEMPVKVSAMRRAMLEELYATEPIFEEFPVDTPILQLPEAARQRAIQALIAFSTETRDISNREAIREIREVVERGLATNT